MMRLRRSPAWLVSVNSASTLACATGRSLASRLARWAPDQGRVTFQQPEPSDPISPGDRSGSVRSHNAEPGRHFHELRHRSRTHLEHYLRPLLLDGGLLGPELGRNLLVEEPGDDPAHDVPFARGQA